jgi:hypothetical protein
METQEMPYTKKRAEQLLDRLDRLPSYRRQQVFDLLIRTLDIAERSAQRDASREPDACKICEGTGRDPMSDNGNWLTCSHCGGSGQEPATASFDPASRGNRG